MTRLRWKKRPQETGLRAIGAGPRASEYTDGTDSLAWIYAHSTRATGKRGWWWGSRASGSVINRTDLELPDEATAKRQAQEYVKAALAAKEPQ